MPLTIAETVWCPSVVLRRLPDHAVGPIAPPAGARRFLGRWTISVLDTFTRIGTIDVGYSSAARDQGSELTVLVLTEDPADRSTHGLEATWAMIDWAALGGAQRFAVQLIDPAGDLLDLVQEVGLTADERRPGVWHARSNSLTLPFTLSRESLDRDAAEAERFPRADAER